MRDETLLKLRMAIASKEFITAQANHELSRGGWLSDWAQAAREQDNEFEAITNENLQIDAANRRIEQLEAANGRLVLALQKAVGHPITGDWYDEAIEAIAKANGGATHEHGNNGERNY